MAAAQESKLSFVTDEQVSEKEFLARGSFGDIYSCKWQGIHCVIKMLRNTTESADKVWALKKLQKEITLLKKLSDQSRHIVKVHGLYICNNIFNGYLMEHCDFGDLRNFLNRFSRAGLETSRFPWLVQSFMLDVCQAMRCLQDEQEPPVLHKDLAIDNVLITGDFRAKLSDFGLSKSLNSLVSQNTLDLEQRIGIERRPPELLLDPLRQPDVYIDRFLFGVCLCESLICASLRQRISGLGIPEYKQMVLSGQLPGRLAAMLETECFQQYPASLQSPVSEFDKLRASLTEAMTSMLALNPEERPTFGDIAESWQRQHSGSSAAAALARERNIVQSHCQPLPQQPGVVNIFDGGGGGRLVQRLDSGTGTVSSGQCGSGIQPTVSIGKVLGNVYRHRLKSGESVQLSPLFDLQLPEEPVPMQPGGLLSQLAACPQLSSSWTRLRQALELPETLEEDILVDNLTNHDATLKVLEEAAKRFKVLTLKRLGESLKALNCHEALVLMKPYAR
uniref:Protein kinase domain-containing protein n=2 Tax=Macrostomum lignano TaxID=282301 RepID=A0A1I8I6A2_9PLAT